MTAQDERQLVDMLSRLVQRSREMQDQGRLRDRRSRAEVTMLEHLLKVARARLAKHLVSDFSDINQRAEALVAVARELCSASETIRQATLATEQKTRRVRKRLYRARLISGSA